MDARRRGNPRGHAQQVREWWLPRGQASKGRHTVVRTGAKGVTGPTSSGSTCPKELGVIPSNLLPLDASLCWHFLPMGTAVI